eukprot:TRINITY_DN21179_c0_g2_i1.p1 TRINITY_DN21179_c0_g2~~TRINITY_DN21179_c0_g2_i1.p1  ORF type:complete len:1354 (+),score=298.99 TRINITY_DN21179_c0_g2_i1:180-4241(+)
MRASPARPSVRSLFSKSCSIQTEGSNKNTWESFDLPRDLFGGHEGQARTVADQSSAEIPFQQMAGNRFVQVQDKSASLSLSNGGPGDITSNRPTANPVAASSDPSVLLQLRGSKGQHFFAQSIGEVLELDFSQALQTSEVSDGQASSDVTAAAPKQSVAAHRTKFQDATSTGALQSFLQQQQKRQQMQKPQNRSIGKKKKQHQTKDKLISDGGFELAGPTMDEDEMEAEDLVAKVSFNPTAAAIAKQVQQTNLVELYKKAGSTKHTHFQEASDEPILAQPVQKAEKWTYQLLAESKPLMKFTRQLQNRMRNAFEQVYRKCKEPQRFEWCILMDNSGSMSQVQNQCAEALTFAIEALRKLEHRFAIARFGGHKSQKILKAFDEQFNNMVGERILESFSYDEGTKPVTAVKAVANTLWKKPLGEDARNTHRVMLLVTDGLSQETDQFDSLHATSVDKSFQLCLLHIKEQRMQGGYAEKLQNRLQRTSIYEELNPEELDNLSTLFLNLIMRVFQKITQEITKGIDNSVSSSAQESNSMRSPNLVEAPTFSNSTHFLPIHDCVGHMDLERALKEGARGQSSTLHKVSGLGRAIPYAELCEGEEDSTSTAGVRPMVTKGLYDVFAKLQNSQQHLHAARDAEASWLQAEQHLAAGSQQLLHVLEECVLPNNKYVRKRADVRGSQLYIPGVIKAEATQWMGTPKIFSSKTAGGRRDYSVSILVDVSLSMQGIFATCARDVLIMLVHSLQQMNINFSLILFGERVKVLKLEEQEWDAHSIFNLLSNLRFDSEFGTLDAVALDCALDLLQGSSSKHRKVFVLTDGYGSCGRQLTRALIQAQELGVDVLAMSVGMDESFVRECYSLWVTAALPSELPAALRSLYSADTDPAAVAAAAADAADAADDWNHRSIAMQDGAETLEEVFANGASKAFPGLLDELRGERELKLVHGSQPSRLSLDVAFCLDVTGSMGPWLVEVKKQIKAIMTCIQPRIQEEFAGLEIDIRYGMVAFRDLNDGAGRLTAIELTNDLEAVTKFMSGLQALGGGDLPEDVLGALDLAAQWDGWKSRVRFLMLITDAPGHGQDLNDDPSDEYKNGDPTGLRPDDIVQRLLKKDIDLVFCRIRKEATMKMEQRLSQLYNRHAEDERRFSSKDLFEACTIEDKPLHFVFCMDASGSMQGKPWQDLMAAYNDFLRRRMNDQADRDVVSIIVFDDNVDVQSRGRPLKSAPRSLRYTGGRTEFAPAIMAAAAEMTRLPGFTPNLIFMSDGQGGDASAAVQSLCRAHGSKGLQANFVAFGSGADARMLQQLASQCGGSGKFHASSDGAELSRTFVKIAAGSGPADGMVKKFGEKMSEMVANKLVVDYL